MKLELEGFEEKHPEVSTWSFSVNLEENLEKKWQAGKNPCTEPLLCTLTCLLFVGEKEAKWTAREDRKDYTNDYIVWLVLLDSHTIPIWKQFSPLCKNNP